MIKFELQSSDNIKNYMVNCVPKSIYYRSYAAQDRGGSLLATKIIGALHLFSYQLIRLNRLPQLAHHRILGQAKRQSRAIIFSNSSSKPNRHIGFFYFNHGGTEL
jgi:hypothetical protein